MTIEQYKAKFADIFLQMKKEHGPVVDVNISEQTTIFNTVPAHATEIVVEIKF